MKQDYHLEKYNNFVKHILILDKTLIFILNPNLKSRMDFNTILYCCDLYHTIQLRLEIPIYSFDIKL